MTCHFSSRNQFNKGTNQPLTYPNKELNTEGVVSQRIGNHHNVPPPVCPGEEGFCEMMDEVMFVREDVIRGDWPADFLYRHFPWGDRLKRNFDPMCIPEPIMRAGVTTDMPEAAAQLVRMDWPTDLAISIYEILIETGVPLKEGMENDFVNNVVGFTAMLAMHLWDVIEKCFQVKWYYGAVRPEEYYGVSGCVFTSYSEGCPNHPGYIAGHGSLAGAIFAFLESIFDFSNHPEALEMVITAVYMFAQFRTLAGVHTAQDNIEGLKFGYRQDIKPIQKP